ncbi:MAG: hypothetical protein R3C03_06225 [Pirellulaceae bacterium]
MQFSSRVLCLWPGLARLWTKGDWASMGLAMGFALLLNVAMVSSFIWPELLGKSFPTVVWPVLGFVWIVSAFVSHQHLNWLESQVRGIAVDSSPIPDTLFNQAQREYLKGNWSEAEILLKRRLQFRIRDVEARLLLATLYRRRGRLGESLHELQTLKRFDECQPWQFEIDRELSFLDELQTSNSTEDTNAESSTMKSSEPSELDGDSNDIEFRPAESQEDHSRDETVRRRAA